MIYNTNLKYPTIQVSTSWKEIDDFKTLLPLLQYQYLFSGSNVGTTKLCFGTFHLPDAGCHRWQAGNNEILI